MSINKSVFYKMKKEEIPRVCVSCKEIENNYNIHIGGKYVNMFIYLSSTVMLLVKENILLMVDYHLFYFFRFSLPFYFLFILLTFINIDNNNQQFLFIINNIFACLL